MSYKYLAISTLLNDVVTRKEGFNGRSLFFQTISEL